MKTVKEVADAIRKRKATHDGQLVVAIAGPPGSGKTTLADDLLSALENAVVVAMDGYHLDNRVLEDRGLKDRKGAPETFDAVGLFCLLERLRSGHEVIAPIFDRKLDLSRAGAVVVGPETGIILVEGNYLLLDEKPWSDMHQFWDMTVMIDIPMDVLKERLIHRWLVHGESVETANRKAAKNDIPNAERVVAHSINADLVVGKLKL